MASPRHGTLLIECAEICCGPEIQADFFQGLSYRRVLEIEVKRILVPTGKGHVPRPGITRFLSALDEQDLWLPGVQFPQDDCHCCLARAHTCRELLVLVTGETLSDRV